QYPRRAKSCRPSSVWRRTYRDGYPSSTPTAAACGEETPAGLLNLSSCPNTDRRDTGGEPAMRWLALLLQVVIPGCIGAFLTLVMTSEFGATVLTIGPSLIPVIIILGGAVIGFLAWLPGLIVDRTSLRRLRLTVVLSILGVTASFLPIVVFAWDPQARSPL